MRRMIFFWLSAVCLGAGSLLVASWIGKDAEVGTGFLDVGDLQAPRVRNHFVGNTVTMQGRLSLHKNGCVTVVLDGVERMPLWPEGTNVSQEPGNLTRYAVDLPGDVTLNVDDVSGDTFSAEGVIDTNSASFGAEADDPPGKIASFLAYCGVEAAPIAFPDAATFVLR
jgi:hypothetical protein